MSDQLSSGIYLFDRLVMDCGIACLRDLTLILIRVGIFGHSFAKDPTTMTDRAAIARRAAQG
ncbi:MAG: hypothetical protein V3U29_02165, partial [Phycisphaeraceae bacterium]